MSFELKVKGKREWLGLAVVVGLTLYVAIALYGTMHIDCSRPAAGEPARCTAGTRTIWASRELAPFTLERGSFRAGRTAPNSRKRTYTAIVAPTGQLEGTAIYADLAQRVIGEADRFYEDRSALEWHVADTTRRACAIVLLIGSVLLGFFFWLYRGVTIVIDPRAGVISRGKEQWLLADLERVHKSDSWRYGSSIDIVVAGQPVNVCRGCQQESVQLAVEAITRAREREGAGEGT